MKSGSGQNAWILDYGVGEDEMHGSEFLWAHQLVDGPTVSSVIFGFDGSQKDNQDNACPKKRARQESSAAPGSKACREKLRRDKLNERFNELCGILEPGKPPKADKIAILTDATRLLSQLRSEAQKLKKSNEALQDNIKSLKNEKSTLRDEKTKLKSEKERIEQMIKTTRVITPQFIPPPALFTTNKYVAYQSNSAALWQWIPPASLDTTKDQAHWPPVA